MCKANEHLIKGRKTMNANNKTVTNGWGVSQTTGSDIQGAILNVYKCHDGSKFKDGKFRMQYASLNGMTFPTRFDNGYDKVCLEHGFLKLYGRNTCKFIMSRAARKRGYTTTDWMYLGRVKRHAEEMPKK
jgi:hypothetical protein